MVFFSAGESHILKVETPCLACRLPRATPATSSRQQPFSAGPYLRNLLSATQPRFIGAAGTQLCGVWAAFELFGLLSGVVVCVSSSLNHKHIVTPAVVVTSQPCARLHCFPGGKALWVGREVSYSLPGAPPRLQQNRDHVSSASSRICTTSGRTSFRRVRRCDLTAAAQRTLLLYRRETIIRRTGD